MKRLLFNFILIFLVSVISAPTMYAAIPISENIEKSAVEGNPPQMENKLKKKIVGKIIQKKLQKSNISFDDEGQNRTAATIIAIIFPFVGVAIWQDRIGKDFWIALLLTALLYLPGLIYALSVIWNGPK